MKTNQVHFASRRYRKRGRSQIELIRLRNQVRAAVFNLKDPAVLKEIQSIIDKTEPPEN